MIICTDIINVLVKVTWLNKYQILQQIKKKNWSKNSHDLSSILAQPKKNSLFRLLLIHKIQELNKL